MWKANSRLFRFSQLQLQLTSLQYSFVHFTYKPIVHHHHTRHQTKPPPKNSYQHQTNIFLNYYCYCCCYYCCWCWFYIVIVCAYTQSFKKNGSTLYLYTFIHHGGQGIISSKYTNFIFLFLKKLCVFLPKKK